MIFKVVEYPKIPIINLIYSRDDKYYHDLLNNRLSFLGYGNLVTFQSWYLLNSNQIPEYIIPNIQSAHVVLVLVSPQLMQIAPFRETILP